MKLGIVIGISKYHSDSFDDLPACDNDATAVADVLKNVKPMDDILILKNENALDARRKISDFVEKFKNNSIEELTFYFSGHGERAQDDFRYIFSDFDRAKKESTSLRNSHIDTIIRTLAPALFIKIVDACYSGTQYIKSSSEPIDDTIRFTASKNGFKNVYFWHSSSSSEQSWAGTEYSYFTESILTSLIDTIGEIRYSEMMSKIADDLSNRGAPQAIFVSQAEFVEKFGMISGDTHKIIYKHFGIDDSNNVELTPPQTEAAKKSFYDLITEQSKSLCHSERDLVDFVSIFNSKIKNWDAEINKIYTIETNSSISPNDVPNSKEIGQWLNTSENSEYFASAKHGTESYEEEEYKKLPQKPTRRTHVALPGLFGNQEVEYRLEKVTKTRNYVLGFSYTHHTENQISFIKFTPKIDLIDPITIFTAILYSNKSVAVHYSYEFLKRLDWNTYTYPQCKNWSILKVGIATAESASTIAKTLQTEVKTWLEDSIRSEL